MRLYTTQHPFYCGIDLHARTMSVCILDQSGEVLVHRHMQTDPPDTFLKAIAPYREGLVVAVACMFSWYWLADLCADEGMPFVLGHARYMKAIHDIHRFPRVQDFVSYCRLVTCAAEPPPIAPVRACQATFAWVSPSQDSAVSRVPWAGRGRGAPAPRHAGCARRARARARRLMEHLEGCFGSDGGEVGSNGRVVPSREG